MKVVIENGVNEETFILGESRVFVKVEKFGTAGAECGGCLVVVPSSGIGVNVFETKIQIIHCDQNGPNFIIRKCTDFQEDTFFHNNYVNIIHFGEK